MREISKSVMNIFLPYEQNINMSVEALDDKRLVKQILEIYQLLQIYEKEKSGIILTGAGYHNHPIYKYYKQYPNFLYLYGWCACQEYSYRFDKCHRYEEYFAFEINSSKRAENYFYIPFYAEGSKNSKYCIRTTENVSTLYQDRLISKWLSDKQTVKWTNRDYPDFFKKWKNECMRVYYTNS